MRSISRSSVCALVALGVCVAAGGPVLGQARPDPLPSWNDGAAKQAIIDFVRATTDPASPRFVVPERRVAAFDQDGTTWVSHPIYAQVAFALDRVRAYVRAHPEARDVEPFRTVLSGDKHRIAKLGQRDLEKILAATLADLTVDEYAAEVKRWIASAEHPRWHKRYTELTYQPMLEVMSYLRANGYRVYIVTGGGQDFVRAYALSTYGIPPEQVVGTMGGVRYGYAKDGTPILTKEPKLLLNDNNAGKPEAIHLMIGQRPGIAFGNSIGDREMLEYTASGKDPGLSLLVLHDDAKREYAYGPAQGLPDTKVGTFTQALYDEAKAKGWVVISMKHDWKRVFAFDDHRGDSRPRRRKTRRRDVGKVARLSSVAGSAAPARVCWTWGHSRRWHQSWRSRTTASARWCATAKSCCSTARR
ncbi:MAG: haloacid dehalogenase-like hydrolase [Deltaproteobacteria bacterium]|nr:haloacid dehalogenase-like hydrolase [Deltaproteobacteria bacterium]